MFRCITCHIISHTDVVAGVMLSPAFVCLFFLHDISKTAAATITKLDIEMFHDESWKSIYCVVKKSMELVMSQKVPTWIFALL